MKWLFLLLWFTSSFTSLAADNEDEYKLLVFDYCWTVSTNMALGEQSTEWPKLKSVDTKAAQWVASFWFTKCHMEFHSYWSSVVDRLKSRSQSEMEANPKLLSDRVAQDKVMAELKANRARQETLMLQCFCYDHAVEIEAMISKRHELALSGESSTLKSTSPASADEQSKIQARLEELKKMRDEHFKAQELELPKAIKEP